MQREEFHSGSPGHLVGIGGGHHAFVPAPLPPVITWSDETVAIIATAERALGRLAGVGQGLGNPHLLIRPYLRREAVLSSQIEGTQSTLSDLLLFEVDDHVENRAPDVREVSNYVRALEYGLERQKEIPLSKRMICEIHRILMTDVRGGDKTPGEFRRIQVHIGPLGQPIDRPTYVPPPINEMHPALDALEKYLHAPSQLPAIVRLAIVHYQFEAIHPFVDGNGRVGRLLITLMLCLDGILPLPLLYLSAFFERHKDEYYRRLSEVSRFGNWQEWIGYFARGVASEAMDGVDRAQRLRDLQSDYNARVQTTRSSALVHKLIEHLFNYPAITTAQAASHLQLTVSSTQKHIDRLISMGIIEEMTGQRRNRIYMAREIVNAINEPSHGH